MKTRMTDMFYFQSRGTERTRLDIDPYIRFLQNALIIAIRRYYSCIKNNILLDICRYQYVQKICILCRQTWLCML